MYQKRGGVSKCIGGVLEVHFEHFRSELGTVAFSPNLTYTKKIKLNLGLSAVRFFSLAFHFGSLNYLF